MQDFPPNRFFLFPKKVHKNPACRFHRSSIYNTSLRHPYSFFFRSANEYYPFERNYFTTTQLPDPRSPIPINEYRITNPQSLVA